MTLFTFMYDGTAPGNPSSADPGCAAEDGVCQNTCNDPDFTWSGASDPGGSEVAGYQVYWGTSSSGTSSTWRSTTSYNPSAVPPNSTYYLRVRTQDNAGNWAAWTTLFTFRYDTAPPDNPSSADPGCAATSGVWQNTCNHPDFTWSGASDPGGCGVTGYEVYWGTAIDGTSPATWRSTASYNPSAVPSESTHYLRVRTQDNAGNWAAWTTLFIFRYDATPPGNPTSASPGCAVSDSVWQHTCANPDFTWSGATDGGRQRGGRVQRVLGDGHQWHHAGHLDDGGRV